jgi:hypothetical protein
LLQFSVRTDKDWTLSLALSEPKEQQGPDKVETSRNKAETRWGEGGRKVEDRWKIG